MLNFFQQQQKKHFYRVLSKPATQQKKELQSEDEGSSEEDDDMSREEGDDDDEDDDKDSEDDDDDDDDLDDDNDDADDDDDSDEEDSDVEKDKSGKMYMNIFTYNSVKPLILPAAFICSSKENCEEKFAIRCERGQNSFHQVCDSFQHSTLLSPTVCFPHVIKTILVRIDKVYYSVLSFFLIYGTAKRTVTAVAARRTSESVGHTDLFLLPIKAGKYNCA